ncbi:G-type lectin S-receptor-like serine/threonine-protein kinase LECRK3 [Prunus yedoensis var. nudiflora]|uniref:G-type lectin S-receptor-like serine/threonine-protein kinase LECRK3 n=1 Tax=Prunus yedoensis var. nudiflora TaxID=2094558 RepID=A0A314XX07_PRUYE|nr:G-type lectin S-receptor-like serine/threonine-protein kinase LECRK3 [Prunus yedoensis var. nudiflora]
MTNNFKEELGRGASLEKVAAEGETEFQTEIRVIGRTHHKNLVRLLGYCIDGATKLLVYEYMSNGSLADVLFTRERQPFWEERMGIARNIARGNVDWSLPEEEAILDELASHCFENGELGKLAGDEDREAI